MTSSAPPTENKAPVAGAAEAAADRGRILLFSCGGSPFAVSAQQVREIVPFRRATRLPGAPSHVAGIINLRGSVVTVIDLAVRLSLAGIESDERCIVLVNRDSRLVGVIVDSVRDVLMLQPGMLEETQEGQSVTQLTTALVRLDGEVIPLLDLSRLAGQVLI